MKDNKKKNSSSDKVWCINAGCWMGMGVEIAETLRQRDYKDPSIVFVPVSKAEQSREVWSMKMEGYHMGDAQKELIDPLMARDYKDPPIVWSMTTEMTPKVAKDKAPALRQRDYKDPPVVALPVREERRG